MQNIFEKYSNKEILSIAKARKRAQESKSKFIGMKYFNLEDLRFSTPKYVADYRAKRLSCNRIVDLCCGIGSQSIAFSKTCKKVLAVEIDERKIKYAEINDKEKKIKFVHGDILSEKVSKQIAEFKPDIIFCDPERLESEPARIIHSIKPSIMKILDIYSKITKNISIELPPQINLEQLEDLKKFGEFEAEYLSFNNKLNRMTVYFNGLKKADISAADVSGARIEKRGSRAEISEKPLKFIYEVSSAVTKAGIENEFALLINAKILGREKNRFLLTSRALCKNKEAGAFSKAYKLVAVSNNFNNTINILKKFGFGRVVLKIRIKPEDYWKERSRYQKLLKGKKEATLFKLNKENCIICEKISL